VTYCGDLAPCRSQRDVSAAASRSTLRAEYWHAPQPSLLPRPLIAVNESLPHRVRSGAFGIIYALSISIFGGSAQFIVAWLTRLTGNPLAPAYYMIGGVIVGLIAQSLMPESAPIRIGLNARRAGTP
jgi:hypothetical protein